MSDVNPWISDLKRQDLQQIESQPFGRPGGDHCYVMWCYDMTWNVMPCHFMLRHVVLCCVMLCYDTLCCVRLHYLVSCFAMLCYYYVFWYFGYACLRVWRVCVCTFLTISTSLYIHTWCLSEWVTTSVTTGLRVPGGNKQVSLHPQIGRNIPWIHSNPIKSP